MKRTTFLFQNRNESKLIPDPYHFLTIAMFLPCQMINCHIDAQRQLPSAKLNNNETMSDGICIFKKDINVLLLALCRGKWPISLFFVCSFRAVIVGGWPLLPVAGADPQSPSGEGTKADATRQLHY